ncbi:polysaccharide pyruvyl transferase family protein [Neotamlana laminarinivorans]|uniref:Polysaccharide pyruvyl transferase family protein n=1 Tax=Neotamlana laminarinivorans TaxID=2883124 RepID=A0A9X1HYN6_9FLAO|nr:polysaccharide pyruvyl transferase family protein [Tamlana laminarinivorans]MCB4798325.1 polysaccharide pyruvyl transferase family protein [Tamlana laminarinivorans]
MRIGILTFHDGINFGAYLQVFSLKQCLTELGHDVKVIHYKKYGFLIKEYIHFIKRKHSYGQNITKINKFHKVFKHLNLTKHYNDVKKIKEDFDVVFFGSDEIWNINSTATSMDTAYFGNGIPGKAKFVSYGPSFGSTKQGDKKLEEIKPLLDRYSSISVRDYNSQKIVTNLTGEEPTLVPDPTFLIDQYERIKYPTIDEKYVIIYASVIKDEDIEIVKAYCKEKGLMLISLGIKYSWADKSVIGISPFEWLGWMKNAEYIFTSMFHGTIFSIILNKNFTVFMDPYRLNKFSYLIDFLGLDNRIYHNNPNAIGTSIDYDNLNKRINDFSLQGKNFIKAALTKINES